MNTLPDTQAILDGLGHGILMFNSAGRLSQYNRAAGAILGTDLNTIRLEGWPAAVSLFNAGLEDTEERLEAVRQRALESPVPVRFRILRSGLFVPCWASAITAVDGQIYIMVTIDVPDWRFVAHVVERFRKEMREAVHSTLGHIEIIHKTMKVEDDPAAQKIARRIGGFTRLIGLHMSRAERLMTLLERLEDIRTGNVREIVRRDRRKIVLADFMEDFLEQLEEVELLDPETEQHDFRGRIKIELEENLAITASTRYLVLTLQELLRNAIMYSLRGTPILVRMQGRGDAIQIDVTDEGYGVRAKEWDRVFQPFERARQPQIISEFGYGLALHLCKNEIEAMNGRLWFSSEENVGTTFSVTLPAWREDAASSSAE